MQTHLDSRVTTSPTRNTANVKERTAPLYMNPGRFWGLPALPRPASLVTRNERQIPKNASVKIEVRLSTLANFQCPLCPRRFGKGRRTLKIEVRFWYARGFRDFLFKFSPPDGVALLKSATPPRRQAKEPESITDSRSGRDRGALPERAASEPRESQKASRREPRASRERAKRLPGASRERAASEPKGPSRREPGKSRETSEKKCHPPPRRQEKEPEHH